MSHPCHMTLAGVRDRVQSPRAPQTPQVHRYRRTSPKPTGSGVPGTRQQGQSVPMPRVLSGIQGITECLVLPSDQRHGAQAHEQGEQACGDHLDSMRQRRSCPLVSGCRIRENDFQAAMTSRSCGIMAERDPGACWIHASRSMIFLNAWYRVPAPVVSEAATWSGSLCPKLMRTTGNGRRWDAGSRRRGARGRQAQGTWGPPRFPENLGNGATFVKGRGCCMERIPRDHGYWREPDALVPGAELVYLR